MTRHNPGHFIRLDLSFILFNMELEICLDILVNQYNTTFSLFVILSVDPLPPLHIRMMNFTLQFWNCETYCKYWETHFKHCETHIANIVRHTANIARNPANILRLTANISRQTTNIVRPSANILRHTANLLLSCQASRMQTVWIIHVVIHNTDWEIIQLVSISIFVNILPSHQQ